MHKKQSRQNFGCLPGNQALKTGCPPPSHGCPGRLNTQFVKPCGFMKSNGTNNKFNEASFVI